MGHVHCRFSLALLAAFITSASATGLAHGGGIATPELGASGCASCHSSAGAAPTVELEFAGAPVRGETVSVTITVSGSGSESGYTLGLGSGALMAGEGSRIISGEATHSAPRAEGAGGASWTVDWIPGAAGSVSYAVWGLSGNAAGNAAGDSSSASPQTGTVVVARAMGDACVLDAQCGTGLCLCIRVRRWGGQF